MYFIAGIWYHSRREVRFSTEEFKDSKNFRTKVDGKHYGYAKGAADAAQSASLRIS